VLSSCVLMLGCPAVINGIFEREACELWSVGAVFIGELLVESSL
jgi:hypothetical protein